MNQSDQKLVRYLSEAHASELAAVSQLESQIAMAPSGPYRDALEKHLVETHTHADRIQERLEELGEARSVLQAFVGFTETLIDQMFALGKLPYDLLRGGSNEEKVLKNAKDACATEELEIASYTVLERLAVKIGDARTAKLAASIRGEEERMLKRVMLEIPSLTDAVVRADIDGEPYSGMTETAGGDATGKVARRAKKTVRVTQERAKRGSRPSQARRPAGGTRDASQQRRSGVSEERLPIERYRALSTEEILSKLSELSERDLGQVDSYERKNQNRPAILSRIRVSRGEEPWSGYDELTVSEIEALLNEGDDQRARDVLVYERAHQNRPEVTRSALVPARFVLSAANR